MLIIGASNPLLEAQRTSKKNEKIRKEKLNCVHPSPSLSASLPPSLPHPLSY